MLLYTNDTSIWNIYIIVNSDLQMSGNHFIVYVIIRAAKSVSIYGSPRRCGGQGDILSGRQVSFSWRILKFPSWKFYTYV